MATHPSVPDPLNLVTISFRLRYLNPADLTFVQVRFDTKVKYLV
jgi:hypothetical protein